LERLPESKDELHNVASNAAIGKIYMAHALFIFENFYPFSHFDFLLTPHVWRTSSGMGTTV
jgi:hypothetical protein